MKLTPRFLDAVAYANQLHATQSKKGGGVPYIAHLLGAAAQVLVYGGDEDETIGALLHDAAEDQGGSATLEEIRRRFGERVADIVESCSDWLDPPKPSWRERKERYVAHLPQASRSARLVSAADKLDNVRAVLRDHYRMGDRVFERFSGRKDGTLWYYRALVDAFRAAGNEPIVEELARAVKELEEISRG